MLTFFLLLLENSNLEAKGFGKPWGTFKSVRPLLCITAWYHHFCAPGVFFLTFKENGKGFLCNISSLCWVHLKFFFFRVKIEGMK